MIVRSKIAHGRDLADHRVRSREYRRWAIVRVLSKKVLPYDAYDRQHLPGAIGIPLGDLDQSTVQQLRADQTVVMYCHDAP
jgi:rhodanese-related sulfurtransferase